MSLFSLILFNLLSCKMQSCPAYVTHYIILCSTIKRTKIIFVYDVLTVDIKSMIEPHPNNYSILKFEEIINTNLAMIPFTQSTILGCAAMSMRPKINALSDPSPWQDPKIAGLFSVILAIQIQYTLNNSIIKTLGNAHELV